MNESFVVGVDLAWGERNRDGLCLLRTTGHSAEICLTALTAGDEALLGWLDQHVLRQSRALLAIDAPIVCPNATGARLVDRETHRLFGRFHAGCHPANSIKCPRPARVLARLGGQGYEAGWDMDRHVRLAAEVYPHPAMVRLFGLRRIIKYKRGSVAEKAAEFARLQRLLRSCLGWQFSEVVLAPEVSALLELPWSKPVEDRTDALFCALVGYHHLRHSGLETQVLGDLKSGFLLVPHAPDSLGRESRLHETLRDFARDRGVEKTFCPSEVARHLWPDAWRSEMPQVRAAAQDLVDAGELRCTQQGERVEPVSARGPIRLAQGPGARAPLHLA